MQAMNLPLWAQVVCGFAVGGLTVVGVVFRRSGRVRTVVLGVLFVGAMVVFVFGLCNLRWYGAPADAESAVSMGAYDAWLVVTMGMLETARQFARVLLMFLVSLGALAVVPPVRVGKEEKWHCLGACRAGGSVIDWVMNVKKTKRID
jgi:hypothetical protein